MQTLNGIGGARAAPLARRQAGESEQAVEGFFQAVGDGAMTQPPLADEGLATDRDRFGRGRIDHVGVVGGDLVMQALGGMGEQVPVLVNRAPLHRHAVPDGGQRILDPGSCHSRCTISAKVRSAPRATNPGNMPHAAPAASGFCVPAVAG